MKVEIDRFRCTGHGRCYGLAPDVYAPDEQGLAVVLVTEVTGVLEEQARQGEMNCPERAITVV